MQGKKSHLLQMRGLKQNNDIVFIRFERSHLLQMRGLKHITMLFNGLKIRSHLLQMRGLKLDSYQHDPERYCRIFYRCVD